MNNPKGPANRVIYVTEWTATTLAEIAAHQQISLGRVVEALLWGAGYGSALPDPKEMKR